MDNNLQQIADMCWTMLCKAVKAAKEMEPSICMYVEPDVKKDFEDQFNNLYNYLLNNYMKNTVKALDRHKVASIIAIALIESNAIKFKGDIPSGKTFFGHYLVAVSVGVSYMQSMLNNKLIEKGENPIGKLWMPEELWSCDRPYFEILCRNLYYARTDSRWNVNPLELSEKFFLLEYVSLEKNGIDPHILKADDHKCE